MNPSTAPPLTGPKPPLTDLPVTPERIGPIVDIEERKEQEMTFHHHHKMDGCEWCEGRQSLWGAFVLGLGVFALGVILILDNFGVISNTDQ